MNLGTGVLAASVLALSAVGVAGKASIDYPSLDDRRPQQAERSATASLTAEGWALEGVAHLTADGYYRAFSFVSPDCGGRLYLTALTANGEMDGMLRALGASGGTIFFVQDGRVYEELPRRRAYLKSRLAPLFARLGLVEKGGDRSVLAVVATGSCARPALQHWSASAL